MKIILKSKVVELSSINNNSIVGIAWRSTGQRTFLIATSEGFKPLDESLSVARSWGEESLKEAVEHAYSLRGNAFLFDTKEELFEWLSE